MITKRYLIDKAMSEIGLAGYLFDSAPDERNDILTTLEGLMAEWAGNGVDVGYPLACSPDDADIEADTGVQNKYAMGIWKKLAIEICPMYGKTPSPFLLTSADRAYNSLLTSAMAVPQRCYPATMPRGAGYKCAESRFYNPCETANDSDCTSTTTAEESAECISCSTCGTSESTECNCPS